MDRHSDLQKADKNYPDQRPVKTIQKAIQSDDFIIHFTFSDGLQGSVNFKPLLQSAEVFKRYLDPVEFSKWKVNNNGTVIEWQHNILDFYFMQIRNYIEHGHWSTH